ncbi:hypothetical protein BCY89_17175 [Sphingobacterium siyangense]|uniref:DUF1800 domain-containing protein n=1 Tax=Sphingobacterium siyangense TaxID=459529 RepID=A0A420FGB0_9SPHI|nr:DUF1800 domain-containing protein [Sphingobacterium siyangense]RKF31881.1 hypothetical protein BCY89_17175 [Sphingobacterium siyangense]
MMSDFKKNIHLANRAGFGMGLQQITVFEQQSTAVLWKQYAQEHEFHPISFNTEQTNVDYTALSKLNAADKKQVQQLNRKRNIEINLNFLNEMVHSEDQLREKMAFFWHGHFASRVINANFSAHILNEIRKNALGSFRDLLFAVSKTPAMLNFLNNQQNKKDHPNENFAREVMELFTMGRGNYTESDVKEAARAFTGWSYDKDGHFLVRKKFHDSGSKTFLGKTGNFDGNAILDIILERPATARFITEKLYRFLVNEQVDQDIVDTLSKDFFDSGYDIRRLLDRVFTAAWFYDSKNVGNKIKSPVELMAGIMRMLPMEIANPENLIVYQKLLGQMLLYPPNVAGWASGKAWIDSSTLFLRMQIPQIWTGLRPLDLDAQNDDDLDMGLKQSLALAKAYKNPKISIDWAGVEAVFADRDPFELLLQQQPSFGKALRDSYAGGSRRRTIIEVMSIPEYQLC